MKGYKASEVFGKLKAADNRFQRMLKAKTPPSVRTHIAAARAETERAIAEYERLKDDHPGEADASDNA